MPRSARIIIPNTPHHVVQRGHNRQTVFTFNDDYNYYCDNLITFKREYSCKIYAYCLMPNHIHLIVDPGPHPESLSKLMKRVAGRQTRYINKLQQRTGSIWEGRFKSSIISAEDYLPACCRYIELNPLRSGLVSNPAQYRWSSYNCKIQSAPDPVVDLPQPYLSLGSNSSERRKAYAQYIHETVPECELTLIRQALQREQVTGKNKFREELSHKLGICLSNRGPGRPRKTVC